MTGRPAWPGSGVQTFRFRQSSPGYHRLGQKLVVRLRVGRLGDRRPVRHDIPDAIPDLGTGRRAHPVRTERRSRVGDALERGDPAGHQTTYLPVNRLDHGLHRFLLARSRWCIFTSGDSPGLRGPPGHPPGHFEGPHGGMASPPDPPTIRVRTRSSILSCPHDGGPTWRGRIQLTSCRACSLNYRRTSQLKSLPSRGGGLRACLGRDSRQIRRRCDRNPSYRNRTCGAEPAAHLLLGSSRLGQCPRRHPWLARAQLGKGAVLRARPDRVPYPHRRRSSRPRRPARAATA